MSDCSDLLHGAQRSTLTHIKRSPLPRYVYTACHFYNVGMYLVVKEYLFIQVIAKEALGSRSNLPGLMNVDCMHMAATKLLEQCSIYEIRPEAHQPLAKL